MSGDPLLGGSGEPAQPQVASDGAPREPSLDERAAQLSKIVAILSAEILGRTRTLGESMYVAHAIYDEVLFRAVTKVLNDTIDKKLTELMMGLYKQGALKRPGGP